MRALGEDLTLHLDADDAGGPCLLFWGERGVGKTTLLTAGMQELLAAERRSPAETLGIEWKRVPADQRQLMDSYMRQLSSTGKLPGTAEAQDLDLGLAGDRVLRVRDIKGEISRRAMNLDEQLTRGGKCGVLFVCAWEEGALADHMRVIRNALRECQGLSLGVAITKAENGLDADDPHWLAPPDWWRDHACFRAHADVLVTMGERVWPTTAFGYDGEGRPACLLGEFGQLLPLQRSPRNVDAPFRWFVRELA